jgi:hypothetical protein
MVLNKYYEPSEQIAICHKKVDQYSDMFSRYYILPNLSFVSQILLDYGERRGKGCYGYIRDRVGAAAIDLVHYRKPNLHEICVGSLSFQKRTYNINNGDLEERTSDFSETYNAIANFIKSSAKALSRERIPKVAYVLPNALELLRQNPKRSPWPDLDLYDA